MSHLNKKIMKQFYSLICLPIVLAGAFFLNACTDNGTPGTEDVPVEKIELDRASVELLKGGEVRLAATVFPDNATDKTVTWESSAPDIADVSEDGTVSALTEGAATITATAGEKTAFCTVTVLAIEVESVTVEPSTIEIMRGETAELTATVLPENAEIKTVIWSSSDEEIVTVDENGVITAVSTGSASVMAEAGNQGGICEVTVLPIPVETVTVTPESVEMKIGETVQLSAEPEPEDADDRSVVWSSSDESVAKVSETGEVTAVSAGDAIITATSGEAAGECSISVIDNPKIGDFYYSDGTYSTDFRTDKTVVWSSSDTDVATVSASGEVVALSEGVADIVAACGGVEAVCTVSVSTPVPVEKSYWGKRRSRSYARILC